MGLGVSLRAGGKVLARGTSEKPIRFTAVDPKESWGVLALNYDCPDGSVFEHCIIEHAGEAEVLGAYYTAALGAHFTSIVVRNCLFQYNTGDDALNIKNADSTIEDCVFYRNAADAVDFDFCGGVLRRCVVMETGENGDGFDIGGAWPMLRDNLVIGCKDKGFSVGEGSHPTIINNAIVGCTMGLASKDSSNPIVVNNVFLDNLVAVSAYQKKTGRGGGKGKFVNNLFQDNRRMVELKDDSKLTFSHCAFTNGKASLPGKGNIQISPQVFPDADKHDYRLGPSAPAPLTSGGDAGMLERIDKNWTGKSVPIGLYEPLTIPPMPAYESPLPIPQPTAAKAIQKARKAAEIRESLEQGQEED
jgi:parallel beta-helix repeat protein